MSAAAPPPPIPFNVRPAVIGPIHAERGWSFLQISLGMTDIDGIARVGARAKGSISRADIGAYAPDRAAGHERGLMRREFAARVLVGVQQDMESLETAESSVEEVSRQLRDG